MPSVYVGGRRSRKSAGFRQEPTAIPVSNLTLTRPFSSRLADLKQFERANPGRELRGRDLQRKVSACMIRFSPTPSHA